MKLVLSSKNKNLIERNGETFLLENSFVCLDAEQTSFFHVYPIDKKNAISFTFCVQEKDGSIFCNCDFVRTIAFPEYLEIEILSFICPDSTAPCLVNESFYETTQGKVHIKILDCLKNNLSIKNGNTLFTDSLFGFEESNINFVSNFVVISYKADNGYFIYIYDIKKGQKIFHCEIEQFELNTNAKKLTLIKKLNDSLAHGEIMEISLDNEFTVIETNLTYLKSITQIPCKEIAFFDCIKAGNFKKAQEFISLELKTVLTKESANAYFKDFNEIVQSKIDFKFYLLSGAKHQTATEIQFEIKDNLINNLKILYNL